MPDPQKPNIIILYADDLGFGDIESYGGSQIPTPNLNRLAKSGIQFNQGYASAATCTPSRYSLLTGSYPWRNKRAHILAGDDPMIIEKSCPTMPKMFQSAGYKTGIVGKWHLGIGDGKIDWNTELQGTPNDVGFETSYIMAATNDRVPCVYLDNRKVENLDPEDPIEVTYDWDKAFPGQPTGRDNPELLKMHFSHGHDATIVNGVSRIGHMKGGQAALWDDETMAEVFAEKAKSFIEENKDEPFFLYYAFHQPHVPRIPGPRFKGVTGLGPRGDVICEMDWCVGEILDQLDSLGLAENTIVIFSSDNGPVLDDGYKDQAKELNGTHTPAGPLRGGKYSLFDGGTRVPSIISWPGTISAGTSDALISHIDFHASFAKLLGLELKESEAPDSFDVLDALLGKSDEGRESVVLEGIQANTLVRKNNWVYIPPHDGPAVSKETSIELGNSSESQLYDLSLDIGQISNVAAEHPQRIMEMEELLQSIHNNPRSRN